jgi:hypothetical protein
MHFTLKYRGDLLGRSSGTGGRVREKQAIRRYLHPQLQELWRTDVNRLAGIDLKTLQTPILKGGVMDVERPILGLQYFFFRLPLGGFNFVPLVTAPQEAHCHLALRLHRPTKPGSILFGGGDLDNRLKVLFDALRIPTSVEEIGDDRPAQEGEVFFCLLADDQLITRVSIESFRLLGPDRYGENYVEMDLDVTVQAVTPMQGTLTLLFP